MEGKVLKQKLMELNKTQKELSERHSLLAQSFRQRMFVREQSRKSLMFSTFLLAFSLATTQEIMHL